MSGALTGLHRVRAMTLNDAHIFCRPDQIKEEFTRVVRLIQKVYEDFGIKDFWFRLSYRDPNDTEKYVQNDAMWEMAQSMLRESMDELGLEYVEAEGEAAFYGPKLDVQVRTALGKDETLSTVQLDFHLPERFGLEYIGEDGKPHRPVVIHRGIVGTMERFVAFLLEYYFGHFPLWLAPIQARILPVSDAYLDYARRLEERFRAEGLRVEVDERNEKLGYKISGSDVAKNSVRAGGGRAGGEGRTGGGPPLQTGGSRRHAGGRVAEDGQRRSGSKKTGSPARCPVVSCMFPGWHIPAGAAN